MMITYYRQHLVASTTLRCSQHAQFAGKPAAQRHAYFLAPGSIGVGDVMTSRADAPVNPGVTKMLKDLPTGTQLHNIESRPSMGGVLCRSAGTSATLVKNGDDGFTLLALPSGAHSFLMSQHCSECKAVGGRALLQLIPTLLHAYVLHAMQCAVPRCVPLTLRTRLSDTQSRVSSKRLLPLA